MIRRRGIPSFCHGDASTSTLQQQLHGGNKELLRSGAGADDDAAASSAFLTVPPSVVGSCVAESEVMSGGVGGPPVTLEQMILQLDLEEQAEAAARKARRVAEEEEKDGWRPRRMSCVDGGSSADHVLRSARDAYPRFSLDGRDAMYRASFSGYDYVDGGTDLLRRAAHRDDNNAIVRGRAVAGGRRHAHRSSDDLERRMPATVAGESVVWCEPGVVAKLMGLEAVPVPVRGSLKPRRKASGPPPAAMFVDGGFRKQRLRRTGPEELAFQKERLFMALHGGGYDVAGHGACHAGAHRSAVGHNASVGIGRNGDDGWKFVLHR